MEIESANEFIGLKEFEQIRILDNFDAISYIERKGESKLTAFLSGVLDQAKSSYVKLTCFKILCRLSILGIITNRFVALSQFENLLKNSDQYLRVSALKYAPFFYEIMENTTLELVKELSDNESGDVSSEAYFALGIDHLSKSFTMDIDSAIMELDRSQMFFEASVAAVENRTDAEFYLIMINFCRAVVRNDSQVSENLIARLEDKLLISNLYDFDEKGLEVNIVLYQACSGLHELLKVSGKSKEWLDVKSDIETVYKISLNIWNVKDNESKKFISFSRHWTKWISKLEELVYANNLKNEEHRLKALFRESDDDNLEKFIMKILNSFPPNDLPTENNQLLAFLAEHFGSEKALTNFDLIGDRRVSPEVLQLIGKFLENRDSGILALRTGSIIGQEVFNTIMLEVGRIIPDYSNHRRHSFELVFEEVIRYARQSFVGNSKEKFKFLFSKMEGGRGDDALEEDLQDDMLLYFSHSKISAGLEHEKAKFVDGGRVDILYKTDLITIPIELKKSKKNQTVEEIESNYIAQAQTYTAGYDQLGLFVLMDLTDKSSIPPPNFRDWFRIHHLPPSGVLPLKYPDLVISVVIPGNRTLPSKKSTYD